MDFNISKMIDDLAALVSFKSELDVPDVNAPFGKQNALVLEAALEQAKSIGLQTVNKDYYGYADYKCGLPDAQMVGILCHLDVVPSGDNWASNPYKLEITDGCLFGRGVVDNKGAAVSVLHALDAVIKSKVQLKKDVRVIFGINEENGSGCIKKYVGCEKIPDISFVPDSDFPIINSEKGILHCIATVPFNEHKTYTNIQGGTRPNMVPENCEITVDADSKLGQILSNIFTDKIKAQLQSENYNISDFSVYKNNNTITLKTRGISAHASVPDKGDNAVIKMLSLFNALNSPDLGTNTLANLYTAFKTYGLNKRLGLDFSCKNSGDLTINFASIIMQKNELKIVFDVRIPLTCTKQIVLEKLQQNLPENSSITVDYFAPNLYISPDDFLVKTLLDVYQKTTGEKGYCIATGGGTYARSLPNAVAFGPTFPNAVSNIHNADECLKITDFYKQTEIYANAILALGNKD